METSQNSPLNINARSFMNNRDGLKISYFTAGEGEPILFIPGLGRGVEMWGHQLAHFVKDYQVIAIDNRGAGQSDKVSTPFQVADMAGDIKDLLDHLKLSQVNVVGASMGGFIAQEFALSHPEYIKSLILCCTTAGGKHAVPMQPETWEIIYQSGMNCNEETLLNAVKLAFSKNYYLQNEDQIKQSVKVRLTEDRDTVSWVNQATAGAMFDVYERLPEIKASTMVITGTEDVVVPAKNSHLIHQQINNSKLKEIKGSGHYLMIESPKEFNQTISSFLS